MLTEQTESVSVYPTGLAGSAITSASVPAGQEEKKVNLKVAVPPLALGLGQLSLTASAPLNQDATRSEVIGLAGSQTSPPLASICGSANTRSRARPMPARFPPSSWRRV